MPDSAELTRVGLDLHDGPLQEAAFLVGHLQALRDDLEDGTPRRRLLAAAEELVQISVALERSLRGFASSLASGIAPAKPFDVALAEVIARFEVRSGLRPHVKLTGPLGAVPRPVADALVYAIGEALENVRKHSDADVVWLEAASDGRIVVEVRDDGLGFDVAEGPSRGLGVRGMRERMRSCGGHMTITSSPGRGTTVRLVA